MNHPVSQELHKPYEVITAITVNRFFYNLGAKLTVKYFFSTAGSGTHFFLGDLWNVEIVCWIKTNYLVS